MERATLFEKYLSLLETQDNKLPTLVTIYGELFPNKPAQNIYPRLGKMNQVYGWDYVFSALLDAYFYLEDDPDTKDVYGLLLYYCKQKAEEKLGSVNKNKVLKINTETLKKLNNRRKLKVRQIFDETA